MSTDFPRSLSVGVDSRASLVVDMKTFSVYLLGREQPVEVRADWFALVGAEGEMPARNLLLIIKKKSLA